MFCFFTVETYQGCDKIRTFEKDKFWKDDFEICLTVHFHILLKIYIKFDSYLISLSATVIRTILTVMSPWDNAKHTIMKPFCKQWTVIIFKK
jgi:hypothetical protein